MSISELIKILGEIQLIHGDIEVVDSYDDAPSPEVVDGVLVLADKFL